ncbi:hypothetical protein HHI36_015042 [Cryptolaemus montrouzieri]|uniref:Reverse transcriptase domain-containing protein n=1 Tax=Cryptolaemus montrouzieri TaxID=559131 RepID=A0ABD2N4I5_9CUCU
MPDEFPPISTLPCIEKVLELALHKQLMEYLDTNTILMSNQSSFRKHYSCEWTQSIDNDDTLLAVSDKNLDISINKMNASLKTISNYFEANGLKLNVLKTKAMILITPFR